MRRLPVVTDTF